MNANRGTGTTAAHNLAQRSIGRREALAWIATAAASFALNPVSGLGANDGIRQGTAKTGYGTDPDLLTSYRPGELWPLTLSESHRREAAALCDVIVPEDSGGPSASSVNVPDFIDEWISAPYPGHDVDRQLIVDGLVWLEAESQKRYAAVFSGLVSRQRSAICDDICFAPRATTEFRIAAQFFKRFRDLTAVGYYTTPAGMKDIGYVGNVPAASFDGPTREVLAKLGLFNGGN
jgi:hypothetical protein